MNIIKPKIEVIEESNPLKKIELAGRTCYKSEKNITDESAEKFVKNLIKHQHTAMLEHATFVFQVKNVDLFYELLEDDTPQARNFLHFTYHGSKNRALISGNLRAILNSELGWYQHALCRAGWENICNSAIVEDYQSQPNAHVYSQIKVVSLSEFNDLTEEENLAHRYTTLRFTCDRGVTHELVRHRLCGFAQESTRYCNYTKDKYGSELTFIEPANFDTWTDAQKDLFKDNCYYAEKCYFAMIENGLTPEQARAVLPNSIKTEIVVTTNLKEWQHMFNLRYFGTTGMPHPDIKRIFDIAYEQYFNKYIRKPEVE